MERKRSARRGSVTREFIGGWDAPHAGASARLWKSLAAPLLLFTFHAQSTSLRYGKPAGLALLQVPQFRRHRHSDTDSDRNNFRLGNLRRPTPTRWRPQDRRPENRFLRDRVRFHTLRLCLSHSRHFHFRSRSILLRKHGSRDPFPASLNLRAGFLRPPASPAPPPHA